MRYRGILAFGAAGVGMAVSSARGCSLVPQWNPVHARRPAVLIGIATADTLPAGAGKVKWKADPGHSGSGQPRDVYGQVFRVDRMAGGPNTAEVVLVPWDYGPDCSPVPWSRSARWLPTGARELIRASLRDSSDWVRGIPTYDVSAPGLAVYRPRTIINDTNGLSLQEAFDVAARLPLGRDVPADELMEAMLPFLQWAKANPATVSRYPAHDIVESARQMAEIGNLARVKSPFFGTYRIRASIDGRSFPEVYARTISPAFEPWFPRGNPRSTARDLTHFDPIPGLRLGAILSDKSAFDSLTRTSLMSMSGPMEMKVSAEPTRDGAGRASYEGAIGGEIWRLLLGKDQVSTSLADTTVAAVFKEGPGPATFEVDVQLPDGRRLRVFGERISAEVYSMEQLIELSR